MSVRPRPGKLAGTLATGMVLVVIGLAVWRPDRPAFRQLPVGPWTVKAADGSRLRVLLMSDTAATVELTDLGQDVPPGRLQRRIALEPALAAVVQFRARAESPQKVAVSLLETRVPYVDLGWHHTLELTPEWRRFQLVLPSGTSEPEAWLCFDVTRAKAPVSIEQFSIARQAWRASPETTAIAEIPRGSGRDLDMEVRDGDADRARPLVLSHGPWTWEAGATYRIDLALSAERPVSIDLVPGTGSAEVPPPEGEAGWTLAVGAGERHVAEFWRAEQDALDGYLALVVRHPPGRLLATGFHVRRLHWHLVTRRQQEATIEPLPENPGGWLVTVADGREGTLGEVQLVEGGLPIAAEAEYELIIRARADDSRTGRVLVTAGSPPYEALGLVTEWPLAADWQTKTFRFRATDAADDANLALELGGAAGRIEIATIDFRRRALSEAAAGQSPAPAGNDAGGGADGELPAATPAVHSRGGDQPLPNVPPNEGAGREVSAPSEPWKLLTHRSARAESRAIEADATAVRIEIAKIDDGPAWQVQWSRGGLALQAGERYELRGRLRSDAPRQVACAVGQDHAPWQGLGLYHEWQATTEWREFRWPFDATADEHEARVYFDLGQSAEAVELGGLEIVELD